MTKKIKTLTHSPENVLRNYSCYSNDLLSLKEMSNVVYGNFYCWDNKLTSLKYGPEMVYDNYICIIN